MLKSPSKSFVLGVGSISLVGLSLVWWAVNRRSLEGGTLACIQSVVDGSADRFYGCIYPYEKAKYGLTKSKVGNMFATLVSPRLKDYEVVGIRKLGSVAAGSAGVVDVTLRNKGGVSYRAQMSCWQAEDGVVTMGMLPLVIAWTAEYVAEPGLPLTGGTSTYANYCGLLEDRSKLKAMGITGFCDDNSEKFVTIDERIARSRRSLETSFKDELTKLHLWPPPESD